MKALTIKEFRELSIDSFLIDLRHQSEFVKGFIPNSLFVGLDGPFDKWLQLVVPNKNTPLLFIAPENREKEAVEKLKELEYTNVIGFLNNGFTLWEKELEVVHQINSITANEFKELYKNKENEIVDVRKTSEYEKEHIRNTILLPLEFNKTFVENCEKKESLFFFCGGGYRSVIAASYLKKNQINNITNIEGGFSAIKKTGLTIIS